jgi:FkbM family methyltransferase
MVKKKIEGFKMYLEPKKPGISNALFRKGRREPCYMWILRQATGDMATDIGANLGYTTLSLCKAFKWVDAFEPDKRSRKLLKKNIKYNGFENKTKINKLAVSDKNGVKTIYLHKKPNLTSFHKVDGKAKKIKTITLDKYYESLEAPNFIKMDVEGAEVEVLRGAMKTLKRTNKCQLLIEVHPQFYKGDNFEKVLRKLIKMGFEFRYVVSAENVQPALYKKHGYEPCKKIKGARRAIYDCLSQEHAINWSAYCHKEGKSVKIVRAILLQKFIKAK